MPPAMDIAGTSNLLSSLQSLRRKVKLLSVFYGLGIVVAAAVALLLAVVFIDYQVPLPVEARIVLNLAALGVIGYALYRWVVKPALARLTLSDLAGQIEDTFPQFDDSLRSTVNFTAQSVPGSLAMQRKTVERATRTADSVDLNRAVALKPVWTSAGMAAAALGVLALVIALVNPNLLEIAANRLLAGNQAWPKRVELVVPGVPNRIPAGQEIPLKLSLKKGTVDKAIVRYRFDNGPWQEQEIGAPGPDGQFSEVRLTARLEGNRESAKLQVQVEAGDDKQDLPAITVVPQLELKGATATITPPAYAGPRSAPMAALERTLDVLAGSEMAVTFEFNRALQGTDAARINALDPARKLPDATWSFPRPGVAVATMKFGTQFISPEALGFTVAATDVDGFKSRSSPAVKVVVREDAKPTLTIESPADRTFDRTAEAFVPLRAVAEDDFGFAYVNLEVKGFSPNLAQFRKTIPLFKNGKPEAGVEWKLAGDSTVRLQKFMTGFQWELSQMGIALKPGDKLEYWLEGQDNFALDGAYHLPPAQSDHRYINIISQQELAQAAEAKAAVAREQINQIQKTLDAAKATAQEQAQETKDRKKFDDAQRATAARMADQQNNTTAQTNQVSKQLQDLAKMLAENRAPKEGVQKAAEKAAEKLNEAANTPMKEAANNLEQAKETKTDAKASDAQNQQQASKAAQSLDKAAQNQAEASKQLEEAKKALEEFGGLETAIEDIKKTLAEQKRIAEQFKKDGKETVGKKPDEMTKEQKEKLDKNVKDQENLAKETEKAIQQMQEKSQKMEKADPAAAQAMKQAAQTGQQQGIPQKQSNKKDQNGAAEQMEQNQQANAQQKHKEIELGLEMMLEKLQAAQRAKLEQLRKELAEVQKLIDALVLAQAGHNIDNLFLQDPKKLNPSPDGMKEEDLVALFDQAQRDYKQRTAVKADLEEMRPAQEQTHRNTMAVAEKAKQLPDATPAGKLNSAATKMEQAIVYLRKTQLADAYQPPQVEALKNLLDAKKLIDAAKQKADDEAKEREQESIRQAYVKLLEDQKKLVDEPTKSIEAGRDAEGNPKRADVPVLNKLPDHQGDLAKRTEDLGKKLESLNSIVYKWANKDIVTSMGEVKEDLGKARTDKVVQTQQLRIEEQLAAMIENLKKQPPKPKEFESRAGGGGGGGQGQPPPKMPTDVELRLLRDLQQAVNKATTVIDGEVQAAAGKKDQQKLTGLGGRQGELRNLLDQLLQEASKGQVKLGDEPDDKVQLPEEATKQDIEDQEYFNDLLKKEKLDGPTIEKIVKMVGDRMGRSRQRLAIKQDPGQVTQEIQKRIVLEIDNLIALAQQQQQQQQGKPQPKPGEKPGEAQAGQGGPQQPGQGNQPGQQQQGGQQAAADSSMNGGSAAAEDLSKKLEESGTEWGKMFLRERGPMRNAAGEQHSPKYDKYIADYYRELAKKASEQK